MTRVVLRGPVLAVWTCQRRLEATGLAQGAPAGPATLAAGEGWVSSRVLELGWAGMAELGGELECELSWWGPLRRGASRPGSEAAIQAAAGLMHLHGLDAGQPRRLGIEVASVAAGTLASVGVLGAMAARLMGRPIARMRLSVLQAALVAIQQYLARASCAEAWGDWWPHPEGAGGPGPPFPTSEGHWVELETTSRQAWSELWCRLGLDSRLAARGWVCMQPRYSTARCSMPPEFHRATSRTSLGLLSDLARTCGVSLLPVRDYAQVLADGAAIRALAHPQVRDCGASSSAGRIGGDGGGRARGVLPAAGRLVPLDGVRVVEATSRVQGPVAGGLLAMLGAAVTRVEPPGGDPARFVAPMAGGTGAGFLAFNRHKQAVEADLSTTSGRARLGAMAAGAEVFLHNWRPGKAQEWGLGAAELARGDGPAVYVGASGWGPLAPSCPPIAMDYLAQAHAGLGSGLNPSEAPPVPSRLLLADFMGGLLAAEGALVGLLMSEASGRRQQVDTCLLGGAMAAQAHVLEAMVAGTEQGRRHGRPRWGPLDRPLPCAEGYLALSVRDAADLDRLRDVVGLRGPCEETQLSALLAERSAGEWEQLLGAAGIACARVCCDLAALCADPGMGPVLEDLGGGASAPVSPWSFCS